MTTVTELREMLAEQEALGNGDKKVMFSYNYGDHWRTTVAATIDTCQEETVEYSAYHSMHKLVDSDEDSGEEAEGKTTAIILS